MLQMEGCTNITHEVAIPLLKGFPPEWVCPLLTIRGPPILGAHVHSLMLTWRQT